MTAWVMRAGRHGEAEQWCLEEGVAGGGWGEVPDLSAYAARGETGELVVLPESGPHPAGPTARRGLGTIVGHHVRMPASAEECAA